MQKNFTKKEKLKRDFVKKNVKNEIKKLDDYSINEEQFLIEDATSLSREELLKIDYFTEKQLKKINKFVNLRKKGLPLNKISQKAYFYLDEFFINNHVLAPRKETEIVVEKVLDYIEKSSKKEFKILDLCCGSGIIGLSIKKHSTKKCICVMSDISKKALKVAKKNTTKFNLKEDISIEKSDLFKGLKSKNKFDIIISNPPYIRSGDIQKLSFGVKNFDPIIALDGGEDGLIFYKRIIKDLNNYLEKDGCAFFEIGFDQGNELKKLLKNDFSVEIYKDYSQNDRVVFAKRN